MDFVTISDFARYYVVVAALWLSAMLLRLVWLRMHEVGGQRGPWHGLRCLWSRTAPPHALSMLGLVVFMVVAIARRFDTLGEPGDGWLLAVTIGVTLVLAGVLINVKIDWRPPWRRHHVG